MSKKILFLLVISLIAFCGVTALLFMGNSRGTWDREFTGSFPVQDLVRQEEKIFECDPKKPEECSEAIDRMQEKLEDVRVYETGYEYCLKDLKRSPETCQKLLNKVHHKPAFKKLKSSKQDSEEQISKNLKDQN